MAHHSAWGRSCGVIRCRPRRWGCGAPGRGFATSNIDAVIIAQEPKLAPFIPAMRDNIAGTLGIAVEYVSIKATTAERLGSIGRGEGIAAEAIVSVKPVSP